MLAQEAKLKIVNHCGRVGQILTYVLYVMLGQ